MQRVGTAQGQSHAASVAEAMVGTLSGFLLSWLVQITLIPKMIGAPISGHMGFWITGVFTAISLVRTYAFRRIFNWLHHR